MQITPDVNALWSMAPSEGVTVGNPFATVVTPVFKAEDPSFVPGIKNDHDGMMRKMVEKNIARSMDSLDVTR